MGSCIVSRSVADRAPTITSKLSESLSKGNEWGRRDLPSPISASTTYVYGERWYIHFHHPSDRNGCKTPLLDQDSSATQNETESGGGTQTVNTNENNEVNKSPAIPTIGAMDAIVCPAVV